MFWLTKKLNGIVLFVSARRGSLSWTKKETHIWVMMTTARINRLFSELNSDENDVDAASLFCTLWSPSRILWHVEDTHDRGGGRTRRGVDWWRSDLERK